VTGTGWLDQSVAQSVQLSNHHYMSADSEIQAWMAGRLPAAWTGDGPADIQVDREEIVVILAVPAAELPDDADEATRAAALAGRVSGFREDTREQRMAVAREAEHRFERKVAWGVRIGDRSELFTHLAVPVMTRLRQPERKVLDTLVAAGVARSRADALAWCVRLVGRNTEAWLDDLRTAMRDVERVRGEGPAA
jgi:hypothetical protein